MADLLPDEAIVIVAIDFGTTFSGYAFSFAGANSAIHMNKNWGGGAGMQSFKTPTCVLTRWNGHTHEFLDFGFGAEQTYVKPSEGEAGRICLYNKFKMKLHRDQQQDKPETMILDKRGTTPADAKVIFAMALRYLKEHAMGYVENRGYKINCLLNVRWVLTVPAIWSEDSKAFMRSAACDAGMIANEDSDKLRIALEPEAASLYCKTLDMSNFTGGNTQPGRNDDVTMAPGTVYMLVDAGGGTVDITVHEVLQDGNVKELIVATGGAFGGTNVDAAFLNVLKRLWGEPYLKALQNELPQVWLEIENRFERSKREASPTNKFGHNVFSITVPMADKYTEIRGANIKQSSKNSGVPGVSLNERDCYLTLSPAAVNDIFYETITRIGECVTELMKQPELGNLKYMFLVGGLSASEYLTKRIIDDFGKRTSVLIPDDPALPVLKGAVMFGQRPDYVRTRIARKTYGVKSQTNFIPGTHKESKKITLAGVAKCTDLFVTYVKKNTAIELNSSVIKSFVPADPTQTAIEFEFYSHSGSSDSLYSDSTNSEKVMYIDDAETKKIGDISIPLPNADRGKKRLVDVSFYFGGTEIKVTVKDRSVIDGTEKTCLISFIAA